MSVSDFIGYEMSFCYRIIFVSVDKRTRIWQTSDPIRIRPGCAPGSGSHWLAKQKTHGLDPHGGNAARRPTCRRSSKLWMWWVCSCWWGWGRSKLLLQMEGTELNWIDCFCLISYACTEKTLSMTIVSEAHLLLVEEWSMEYCWGFVTLFLSQYVMLITWNHWMT